MLVFAKFYSDCNATTGLILVVRRAGSHEAMTAIMTNKTLTTAMAQGFSPGIAGSICFSILTRKNEAAAPMAAPITASIIPFLRKSHTMLRGSAPNAIRMPISFVLSEARLATTP